MKIEEDVLVRWTLSGFEKAYFLSAIAKIYHEINKMGFSAKMDLNREELDVFNDFVEQLAQDNQPGE